MAKKIINDIVLNKKSIRQIPVSVESRRRVEKALVSVRHKPLNPKFVIWLIAIICLLSLFFGISLLFSKAVLTITPRQEKIVFNNDSYPVKLNSTSDGEISLELLKVEKTVAQDVLATEEKEVKQKATGKILIYNNYSSVPQRLINNTRFESASGKIYRLSSSITVPGTKVVDGKTLPGSIEAVVFADQAGVEYNLKLSDLTGDFKVPGFKGTPRYTQFYGRLKEDITGGLVGLERVVKDDLRQKTETLIRDELKEQLLKELYAVLPENYLVFTDGYTIEYQNLPDSKVDTDKVKISLAGVLNASVFNNLKLTQFLASRKISGFEARPALLLLADSLTVTTKGSNLVFNGESKIQWQYDGLAIRKDLVGKSGSDLQKILAKYKDSFSKIEVSFRPVWTQYFPDNIEKIKIQEITS